MESLFICFLWTITIPVMGNDILTFGFKLFGSQTEQAPQGKIRVYGIFMCTSLLKKPGDSEGWTSEGGKNTFGVHIQPMV